MQRLTLQTLPTGSFGKIEVDRDLPRLDRQRRLIGVDRGIDLAGSQCRAALSHKDRGAGIKWGRRGRAIADTGRNRRQQ